MPTQKFETPPFNPEEIIEQGLGVWSANRLRLLLKLSGMSPESRTKLHECLGERFVEAIETVCPIAAVNTQQGVAITHGPLAVMSDGIPIIIATRGETSIAKWQAMTLGDLPPPPPEMDVRDLWVVIDERVNSKGDEAKRTRDLMVATTCVLVRLYHEFDQVIANMNFYRERNCCPVLVCMTYVDRVNQLCTGSIMTLALPPSLESQVALIESGEETKQ
jgi:hypothetical protein